MTERLAPVSDALSVRTEFLSRVSHELRAPLASLDQLLTIVLGGRAGPITAEQREYLGSCLRNARQLRSLIGDLIDVARVQAGELRVTSRPLELAAVIEDVIETERGAAEARGITICAHHDALPAVIADELRVRQILTHLIENAIKYSAEGGEIELTAGRDPRDPSFVLLALHDTGCGVAPEAHERIFDSLRQHRGEDWRSRKGLGIGLYLCKELVARHGGSIWVESERGKGSTFCFTLPEFDFAKLVAPAILRDGALCENIAIIRVDLDPAGAHASHAVSAALARRAHHLLKTCLLPGDTLLPLFVHAGGRASHFAVAATDRSGMESICARIRDQLTAWSDLREAEIQTSVRGLLLHWTDADRARPDAPANAAREIERCTQIDSHWSE